MEVGIITKWTLGLTICLVMLELLSTNSRKLLFSSESRENLFWLVFNKLCSLTFLGSLIVVINDFLSRRLPFQFDLTSQGVALQFVIFFLVSDLMSYIAHRILHASPWLWRFHKLHHSSKELTTLSAFRHHTLEDLWYAVTLGLISSAFHLQEVVKFTVYILMIGFCYFQHSHLHLRLPYWLNHFFITPLNHRWHHSTDLIKSKGQNFGFILPVWDKFFGTFFVPENEPPELGIKGSYPSSLWRRWFHPFHVKEG